MTKPFPTPSESKAAHLIAQQAVDDAGLKPHESGGAKTTLAGDALAGLVAKATVLRKVNSGKRVVAKPAAPWYRRFDI